MIDGEEREFMTGETFKSGNETIYPLSRTFIPAKLSDNPFLTGDPHYRAILQSLPEPLRSQMLNGDFHASAEADPWQVIPTEWVRAAQRRWIERVRPDVPLSAAGLDPARGGRDNMSLSKRYENYFDKLAFWPGAVVKDGPVGAELVHQALGDEVPGVLNVDIGGIGAATFDSLKVMYPVVNPVNSAGGSEYHDSTKKYKMRNVRAEMYWRLRENLDPKNGEECALPPGNEVVADLCSAHYKPSVSGVIIEDKEQIKARLGRSPDKGESIMLANYPSTAKNQIFI
jgi:hypothetical protein